MPSVGIRNDAERNGWDSPSGLVASRAAGANPDSNMICRPAANVCRRQADPGSLSRTTLFKPDSAGAEICKVQSASAIDRPGLANQAANSVHGQGRGRSRAQGSEKTCRCLIGATLSRYDPTYASLPNAHAHTPIPLAPVLSRAKQLLPRAEQYQGFGCSHSRACPVRAVT